MSRETIILDTGPLVALLDRKDHHHDWAMTQWAKAKSPFHTCEAVLSEACFLLARRAHGDAGALQQTVLEFVRRGAIVLSFSLAENLESVATLAKKYADAPMSLADASLVRMTELRDDCRVMTCDQHFRTYRRHGRQVIPVIMPGEVQ